MANDGIYLGGMIRNYQVAENNARAADREAAKAKGWYEYAQRVDADLAAANARIAELELEAMHAAGRDAQFAEFKAQHPDSPLFADSGKRFKKSGNPKTAVRLIYEAAFDAKAEEMGITNPVERRED